MKYRAITMQPVEGLPLQSFSESMEVIQSWARTVSKKHDVDVKVYETYERVLTIVRKPQATKGAKEVSNA